MPNMDKTGPNGQGSRTGRQMGTCGGNFQGNTFRRGLGRCPRGQGLSQGRGFGQGRGYSQIRQSINLSKEESVFHSKEDQIKILEAEKTEIEKKLKQLKD